MILINLYYLYKMSKVEKVHKIVECKNDPKDNHVETYTKEGHYYNDGESDEDLIVEVNNDAITKRFGVDPLAAAAISSAVFGDPRQYSQEELRLISRLTLAATAFAAM